MQELDASEIEQVLRENGVGTLCLCDDGLPYGIPMSFGYGDEMVSFLMQRTESEESRKFSVMKSNPKASFLVFDDESESTEYWRSVLITGDLYFIPEEEEAEAFFNLKDNAEFAPDFDVLDVPIDHIDLHMVGLTIDEIYGREYSPNETMVS